MYICVGTAAGASQQQAAETNFGVGAARWPQKVEKQEHKRTRKERKGGGHDDDEDNK
jgi:hypothetical protein